MEITVTERPELHRFEVRDAGALLGYAEYQIRGEVLAITHTEVEPARQGQGIASLLIAGMLDQVRASGRQVLPLCPFVVRYLEQHDEYRDVAVSSHS